MQKRGRPVVTDKKTQITPTVEARTKEYFSGARRGLAGEILDWACKNKFDPINLPENKVYKGKRVKNGTIVTVNGAGLNFRTYDINNESIGFDWGNSGRGADQLALAILYDYLGNNLEQQIIQFYLHFRNILITPIVSNNWVITSNDIEEALEKIPLIRS